MNSCVGTAATRPGCAAPGNRIRMVAEEAEMERQRASAPRRLKKRTIRGNQNESCNEPTKQSYQLRHHDAPDTASRLPFFFAFQTVHGISSSTMAPVISDGSLHGFMYSSGVLFLGADGGQRMQATAEPKPRMQRPFFSLPQPPFHLHLGGAVVRPVRT
jgi:hypothetical protein